MSTPPIPATEATQPDAWRPVLVRQVELLGQIAEAGVEVVMALRDRVTVGADTAVDPEAVALAFSRVSRAVRMSMALQSKLIEDIRALDRGDLPDAKDLRRKRVQGVVERVALAEQGAGRSFDQVARLSREMLEDEDLYDAIPDRPMSEVVHMICRDLGLSPDWTRLIDQAWAQREIEGGAVGAPLKDPETFTAASAKAEAQIGYVVQWATDDDPETGCASP